MSDFPDIRAQWGLCELSGLSSEEYDRIFYPSDDNSDEALQFCNECELQEPCLAYARQTSIQEGVWGGVLFTSHGDSGKDWLPNILVPNEHHLPDVNPLLIRIVEEGACFNSGLTHAEIHEAFIGCYAGKVALARAKCMSCPVRSECLTDAYRRNVRYGVQGGSSKPDRQKSGLLAQGVPGKNIVDLVLQLAQQTQVKS